MKNLKSYSVSYLMKAVLAVAVVVSASCGNIAEQSAEKERPSNVSLQTPKPPGVDVHTATFLGDLKTIDQHIRAGTDLNKKDAYGSSPLIIATTFGKTKAARMLIEGGADTSIANNDGSTPLHIAAFLCRPEIVEILLDRGADKTIKNKYGSTAMETVDGGFEDVRAVYDQLGISLGPLGLELDYEYLKATRPKVADLLR